MNLTPATTLGNRFSPFSLRQVLAAATTSLKTISLAVVGDSAPLVLDILLQSPRDARAAKRLLCKLLERQCRTPRVIVTDKLESYGAAKRAVMPSVEHRKHKRLNNRAENSHQPTRHGSFYPEAPRT